MKKRKIAIVGLPMYAKKLSDDLNNHKGFKWCYHFDTYYNRLDRLKLFLSINKFDLIFSINGTLQTSKLFDLASRKRIPVIMLWAGTDVLHATEAYKNHPINFRKEYITNHYHAAVSPQLSAELSEIGIDAKFTIYQNFEIKSFSNTPFTSLKALVRIAKGREEFYGLNRIVEIAKRSKEFEFTIVGTDFIPNDAPKNMKFMGWVNEMSTLFDEHVVALRLPVHDGLSPFVLEALANGCYVCYNQELEHTEFTQTNEEVVLFLDSLRNQLDHEGKIERNRNGIEFIKDNFEFKVVNNKIENLIDHVIASFNE